jgi:hypothetical protein
MPVAFPTPLIVHVVNGPDPLAVCTTLAAVVAVVVALITLNNVLKQIKIASAQLKLAREEVDYVKEDLELSRQQLREIARRPDLSLSYQNGELEGTFYDVAFGVNNTIDMPLRVINNGFRATRGWQVVLFVPAEMFPGEVTATDDVFGVGCVRRPTRNPHLLYPSDSFDFEFSLISLRIDGNKTYTIYFRVYDEFGSYPSGGEYGTLTIRTAWLTPGVTTRGFH